MAKAPAEGLFPLVFEENAPEVGGGIALRWKGEIAREVGGRINVSCSPGQERSAVTSQSFSFREAECHGLAVGGTQIRCWFMTGALEEGILREHLSPGVGLGVQQQEHVGVLPILPWIPTRKTMRVVGLQLDLERRWCLPQVPRCVLGQVLLCRWEGAGRVYLAPRGELQ